MYVVFYRHKNVIILLTQLFLLINGYHWHQEVSSHRNSHNSVRHSLKQKYMFTAANVSLFAWPNPLVYLQPDTIIWCRSQVLASYQHSKGWNMVLLESLKWWFLWQTQNLSAWGGHLAFWKCTGGSLAERDSNSNQASGEQNSDNWRISIDHKKRKTEIK